jgi:hypothetical protein
MRKPRVDLEQQLRHELAEARENLAEALEQQAATSEVLQVISTSSGELEPVFQAMLANAVRLCDAKFGTLYLHDGDAFRAVAIHNAPPAFAAARGARRCDRHRMCRSGESLSRSRWSTSPISGRHSPTLKAIHLSSMRLT